MSGLADFVSPDFVSSDFASSEVVSEGMWSRSRRPAPRERELPTCAVCADTLIAAEASAFLAEDVVRYLWTCETCGYGFVTEHAIGRRNCN